MTGIISFDNTSIMSYVITHPKNINFGYIPVYDLQKGQGPLIPCQALIEIEGMIVVEAASAERDKFSADEKTQLTNQLVAFFSSNHQQLVV